MWFTVDSDKWNICFQGGASGGGAAKAVKTDELDIDIEKEARGHRVRQTLLLQAVKTDMLFLSEWWCFSFLDRFDC